MSVFEAMIRVSNGGLVKVQIRAENVQQARQLLEAQYGRSAIFTGPL
jgi:hypothetical protein